MVVAEKKTTTWRKKLKRLRNTLGLTQREAAEQAGVALRTWINWENRHQDPGRLARRLLQLAFPKHF